MKKVQDSSYYYPELFSCKQLINLISTVEIRLISCLALVIKEKCVNTEEVDGLSSYVSMVEIVKDQLYHATM